MCLCSKAKRARLLFYRSRILSTRQKTTFGTKVAFRYAVLEISKLRKDFFTKVKLCFKICIYIYIKLQVCLLNERFFFKVDKNKYRKRFGLIDTLHKEWSFPLRISSVNVTKSLRNCGFGHIYWRNPKRKNSFFFVQLYK